MSEEPLEINPSDESSGYEPIVPLREREGGEANVQLEGSAPPVRAYRPAAGGTASPGDSQLSLEERQAQAMVQEMERRQKEQLERLKRDLRREQMSAADDSDAPKTRKREMRELDLKILREVGSDKALQNARLGKDLFITAWSGNEAAAADPSWGKPATLSQIAQAWVQVVLLHCSVDVARNVDSKESPLLQKRELLFHLMSFSPRVWRDEIRNGAVSFLTLFEDELRMALEAIISLQLRLSSDVAQTLYNGGRPLARDPDLQVRIEQAGPHFVLVPGSLRLGQLSTMVRGDLCYLYLRDWDCSKVSRTWSSVGGPFLELHEFATVMEKERGGDVVHFGGLRALEDVVPADGSTSQPAHVAADGSQSSPPVTGEVHEVWALRVL